MSAPVTATFVFTDLVDSTATASRLGPEAAEELRRTHFRLLRGAVSSSGGTEVKNLGDGLMVMYSSPSRALSGAAGMQQAIEHHNRSADEPLGVRIGVSVGEAIEEDDDYFGDPVVEAARLCAAAQGGQILVTEMLRMMVGRHATQTFVELGPLDLKGLPEPVDAVEVVWEPVTVSGSVPLPGRLVGAASDALFGFFGRAPELEALDDARKRASSTRRAQLVFVSGEAGMGKTALVGQAARTAHAEGAVVLFGHADEDLVVAYRPWIEVTKTVVTDGDPELLSALPSAQRTALAHLVPQIDAPSDRLSDPDMERLLLWEGITELLASMSREHPVFLVLDDLHWADTASLQLLRHVIAANTPMDVTIACTYRDTDLGPGASLTNVLSDLRREANVVRLELRGLEDTDLMELLAAAAGHDLDDAGVGLAHELRRETDGNPFFAGELLRHLGETGGIVLGDNGRWSVGGDLEQLGLPSSVRDVVGRRVGRLGSEALRVLSLAAVIGREFDIDLLAALVDVDEDALLDLMDAGVAAAVLVDGEVACRYRFSHALIQHSLYDELSPTRRQRAHQRVAETLEAANDGQDAPLLAELAHHWVAATRPTDVDRALDYVRRAGDAALDALAPDDAIRWYEQALELLTQQRSPDQHQRARILATLGTARRQAGDPSYRDALRQAAGLAIELDDTDVLVQAGLGFAQWANAAAVGDDDAKAVNRAALDRIGMDQPAKRAQLLAAYAVAHDASLDWHTRRSISLEAIEAARRAGDDATFVHVIDATYFTVGGPDHVAKTIDDIAAAAEFADRTRDPVLRARIALGVTWARYQQADIEGVDAALAQLEALDRECRLPNQRWQIELMTTGRLLLAGRADEADEANERALGIGVAAGVPQVLAAYGGILFCVRQHQGRLAEISDLLIDAARDNPSIASLRALIPDLLAELGHTAQARERLAEEAVRGFDLPVDMTWLAAMANLTDTAATTGDRDLARDLVDRLRPYAAQVIAPIAVIVSGGISRPMARAAAVLGDYDQAEEWFAIAHDLHGRLRAPFWTARGQLDHADLCLARRIDSDLERARELITTAAATAAEYGCAGLTRRADVLLADL